MKLQSCVWQVNTGSSAEQTKDGVQQLQVQEEQAAAKAAAKKAKKQRQKAKKQLPQQLAVAQPDDVTSADASTQQSAFAQPDDVSSADASPETKQKAAADDSDAAFLQQWMSCPITKVLWSAVQCLLTQRLCQPGLLGSLVYYQASH